MLPPDLPIWIDGRQHPRERAVVAADDSAYVEGLGCYTTARVDAGVVRWPGHHARRLARDAEALGLGVLESSAVEATLVAAARDCFGSRDGALRLQCSCDRQGLPRLIGIPRQLGPESECWTATWSPHPHTGPHAFGGAKICAHWPAALGRRAARAAGCDEALLCDAEGYLIEGSRSNIVVALPGEERALPDPARGGVAGLALAIASEQLGADALVLRDLHRSELAGATEIVALNAVRGARSIVSIDGERVGSGRPGPLQRALAQCLAEAPDSTLFPV